jgi:predicted nucleotidyltransferase
MMIKTNLQIAERKKDLKQELKRIVEVIIRDYQPQKIILFGSLAGGEIHEWSDIDLVIIKDTSMRFIKRIHEVRFLTRPKEAVDFIVYTPGEMQEMREEGRRFLIKEILEKGRVLYEREQKK